jgi:beta-xylosidase
MLIAGSSLFNFAAVPDSSAAAPGWAADNGYGTYSNPLFYEEFEDPDVIRMGEDYYLAARPCT